MSDRFPINIDVRQILNTVSAQIYDTHLAFLRENVQNAVDAVRIQALRDGNRYGSMSYRVDVQVQGRRVRIADNGIGMTLRDQRDFFWTMGASGKRNDEARSAGCIGSFGIGGFANLGVCDSIRVASRSATDECGYWTQFSTADLHKSSGTLPEVSSDVAQELVTRGTILDAELREQPDTAELEKYLEDCVRYAPELVTFNGRRISQKKLSLEGIGTGEMRLLTDREGADALRRQAGFGERPAPGLRSVRCRWFEDQEHLLYAELLSMHIGSEPRVPLAGFLCFRKGRIIICRRGFKICDVEDRFAAPLGPLLLSGVVETDRIKPTAGRDSLDEGSNRLLVAIVDVVREDACKRILDSADRIAQYPTIYGYLRGRPEYIEHLGKARISLTGGDRSELSSIREQAANGTRVFYSQERNGTLAGHLKAHGSVVVELEEERSQAKMVQMYLEEFCNASSADDRIECLEEYAETSYSKFDHMFLGDLEEIIITSYNLQEVKIRAGKLSSELAAYAAPGPAGVLEIYVDLKHPEVLKLHSLPQVILPMAIRMFCLQFFGDALKKASPRFFGDGSLNFDFMKERAEEWILVRGEIVEFGPSDIHEIRADEPEPPPPPGFAPKLVHLLTGNRPFSGYYLRLPGGMVRGFRNEILDLDLRAATWASNHILLLATDGLDTSFNTEIKLEVLVRDKDGGRGMPGSALLKNGMLSIYGGLYFPIPAEIEPALVPSSANSIKISVSYDLVGVRAPTGRSDDGAAASGPARATVTGPGGLALWRRRGRSAT